MALDESSNGGGNGFFMPVAPAYGGGNGSFGGNAFGGDWAWIILLLLLGWGNNGGGFGNNSGGYGGNSFYPWMNQANLTTEGFQNQLMNDNSTSIRDGVNSLSTQLCNCCSDTQMSIANLGSSIEQGANARQIANMQQAFAAQTAMSQGFNGIQAQLAQCCCDNRLATAQTQNIVQNEGNATRFADATNTRDIIESQTNSTRAILDKLCQLELDNYKAQLEAKNDTIAQLRSDVLYARGQASQDVQTARILAGQTAEVDALYNRLNECPVGTTPVYGRTPIFTCNNNNGCGCGCGGF